MSCTGVVYGGTWDYDNPHKNFCRCPVCKGFLPHNFPDDKPFTCKKCKTELMVFAVHEDDEDRSGWDGKICPISSNKHRKRST